MPSTELKAADPLVWSQKSCGQPARHITQLPGDSKTKIVKNMPCSPYEKCGVTIPEPPLAPGPKMDVPPPEKNGVIRSSDKSDGDRDTGQPTGDGAAADRAGSDVGEGALRETAATTTGTGEKPGEESADPATTLDPEPKSVSGKAEEAGREATALDAKPEPETEKPGEAAAEATTLDAKPETETEKPGEAGGEATTLDAKPETETEKPGEAGGEATTLDAKPETETEKPKEAGGEATTLDAKPETETEKPGEAGGEATTLDAKPETETEKPGEAGGEATTLDAKPETETEKPEEAGGGATSLDAKPETETEKPGEAGGEATTLDAKPETETEKPGEVGGEATTLDAKPETETEKPGEAGGGATTLDAKPETETETEKPGEAGSGATSLGPKQKAETKAKPRKPKPKSFSLLQMEYRDPEGKGQGWLERHCSLSALSRPQRTRALSAPTMSAPAAISSAPEPSSEEAVFIEGLVEPLDASSTTSEPSERSADGKSKPQTERETETEVRAETDGGGKEGDEAEEGVASKGVETEKPEKIGDRESESDIGEPIRGGLTPGLERDGGEGRAPDEVASLAKDFERGMRLEAKAGERPGLTVSPVGSGTGRLRAKGIEQMDDGRQQAGVLLSNSDVFASQASWMHVQQQQQQQQQQQLIQQQQQQLMYQQQQLMQQQRQQPALPSFQCVFKRPQTSVSSGCGVGPFTQSVVSPPGQFFRGATRSPMVRPPIQSKQIQYAQQNLLHETQPPPPLPPQAMQQSYAPDQSIMSVPGESTGCPSEMEWPPTPESDISDVDDLLELTGSILELTGIHSPPSVAASCASMSPAASSYADPSQSPSPDMYAPLSPESNVGSPARHIPPPSSPPEHAGGFVHIPGTMSSGRVMVAAAAAVAAGRSGASKRKRNDSSVSTDSLEAKEGITRIKNYLKQPQPDASPTHSLACWTGSPQQSLESLGYQSAGMTPPYVTTPSPVPVAPPQPSPTAPVPIVAPRSQSFREGELDAYRRKVSNYSVDDLMAPDQDEDKDTALHLAVCQMKEALAVAIIERVSDCVQKHRLNDKNLEGQTPLFLAAVSNLPLLTEFLIIKEADPSLGNVNGDTPLHMAAKYGNNEAINAILEGLRYRLSTDYAYRHKLFNTRNYAGKTPLILAVENHGERNIERNIVDCTETVKLLLGTYASALVQDSNSGKTALHYAMELPKLDMMEVLLSHCDDAGQLANSQMYDGNTALHLIVGRSLPESLILEVVGRLMANGANVGLENAAKDKPQSLVLCEHTEVKRRLHGQGNRRR